MRELILDLVESSLTTGFNTSGRLPYDQNDTPLYLQNFKRIYVDLPQTEQDPLYTTLDGKGAVNETIAISVYFATDAKTLPNTYDTQLTALKAVRINNNITGYNQRTTNVSTEYVDDALVTTLEYVFVKTLFDH
jgi:hypothetical protein